MLRDHRGLDLALPIYVGVLWDLIVDQRLGKKLKPSSYETLREVFGMLRMVRLGPAEAQPDAKLQRDRPRDGWVPLPGYDGFEHLGEGRNREFWVVFENTVKQTLWFYLEERRLRLAAAATLLRGSRGPRPPRRQVMKELWEIRETLAAEGFDPTRPLQTKLIEGVSYN